LILSLVLVVLLLLIGGAVAAIFLLPSNKKSDTVAASNPPPSEPGRRGPPRGGASDRGSDNAGPSGGSKSTGSAPAEGGSVSVAAGQEIFQQKCTRCHGSPGAGSGGAGGAGGRRGGRGPDLSTIGQQHDEDWFVEFVRDPNSKKPGSRMRGFGDSLSEDQLRAVAKYLASLK
jgi:mono/diheme cytochrome c family protein